MVQLSRQNSALQRSFFAVALLSHTVECKAFMEQYLGCLKSHGSTSTPCRTLSQQYLECRMNRYVQDFVLANNERNTRLFRGLMERDTWKNLGFAPPTAIAHPSKDSSGTESDGH